MMEYSWAGGKGHDLSPMGTVPMMLYGKQTKRKGAESVVDW